ncbi:MAG: response regulator [Bdellovibrionales bacterium]
MKLLVVDDEVDIGELIVELAEDKGMQARAVSDSADVAGVVAEFQPNAIMLDLMMPGTDGIELLKTLADKLKGVKIALMSGTDARVLSGAQRLGSAHGLNIIKTLEKPLEISAIRAALDDLAK